MRDQVQYYLDRARAAAVSGVLTSGTDIEPLIDGLIRTFDKIYADRSIDADNQVEGGTIFRGEKQDFEEMAGTSSTTRSNGRNRRSSWRRAGRGFAAADDGADRRQ